MHTTLNALHIIECMDVVHLCQYLQQPQAQMHVDELSGRYSDCQMHFSTDPDKM